MSQADTVNRLGATWLGIESTLGTLPSMTRVFPAAVPDVSGLSQDNVKVEEEHPRGFRHQKPIQGLKSTNSEVKLAFNLKPDTTQLLDGGSASTPWLGVLLKAGLGGEASGAGTTVAAMSTTTDLKLTSATGFAAGGILAAEVNGTLEVAKITTLATADVTPWPSFSATPNTSSGVVVNSYCYYPTQSNTQSLSFQHAKATGSTNQWEARGCTSALEFKIERGALLQVMASLKAATWDGPANLSLSATAASDGMAAPLVARTVTCFLQSTATLTRTPYKVQSCTIKITQGDMHVPELGGVEGVSSMMRIPNRPFGTVSLKFRSDTVADSTWYVGQTDLALMVIVEVGSGLTKRFVVFDCATCVVAAKPKFSDDGGRLVTELELEMLEDATASATTDLSLAPFRVALI